MKRNRAHYYIKVHWRRKKRKK